jgi:S1-C subfamily serine protease
MATQKGFSEGDSVYFVGLMPQYYGEQKNYPVLRRGSVALLTDEEISTPTGRQKAFLVEMNVWPGNSGSPVFVEFSGMRNGALMLGGGTAFIGIVQGHYNDVIPAETVPSTNVYSGDSANTGIGFVIPADAVLRILESPRAQEQRTEELRRRGLVK